MSKYKIQFRGNLKDDTGWSDCYVGEDGDLLPILGIPGIPDPEVSLVSMREAQRLINREALPGDDFRIVEVE